MNTTISEKPALALEKQLFKNGKFTLNDAVSITGLGLREVKALLDQLMHKYDCRLQVTKSGDLIYDFGKTPHRRGEKTWEERWKIIKKKLWQGFKVFYKIWITVTLVAYFIIFLIILLGIIFGLNSRNDNNSRSDRNPLNGILRGVFASFRSIFIWNTIMGRNRYYYEKDNYGYPYKHYQPQVSQFNPNKKSFISSVYDFVFGPPRVEADPNENYKEVAAFARQNKGIVSVAELKGLAGWSQEEAQSFLSECVVRFDGDIAISDRNILYADFYELTRSLNKNEDGKIVWYWDEYEADYELTGNKKSRNITIALINSFNLIFAGIFLFGAVNAVNNIDHYQAIQIGLGWIPFLFSFIFFLVPAIRYFQIQPLKKKRHQNNINKRLYKVIYQQAGKPINQKEIMKYINQGKEEQLSQEQIEKHMSKLLLDWNGEVIPNEDGSITYKFDLLKKELDEMMLLRKDKEYDTTLGKIVLDTK